MPEMSRSKIRVYKDPRVLSIDVSEKPPVSVERRTPGNKKNSAVAGPPAVVDSVVINKMPATPVEPMPTRNEADAPQGNTAAGGGGAGASESAINTGGEPVVPVKPIDRNAPTDAADVMPQYPGGVAALLEFLKANLQAPEELSAGEDVSVTVQFVVNYNGKLQGFDILQSGGRAFDDAVLKVLKKMPLWIPGRSNGENVSVYFVVPVRFTGDN